jgi:hypothetical protein
MNLYQYGIETNIEDVYAIDVQHQNPPAGRRFKTNLILLVESWGGNRGEHYLQQKREI